MAVNFYHVEGATNYSTAAAAEAAASAGNTIELSMTEVMYYSENITFTNGLNWIATTRFVWRGTLLTNNAGGLSGNLLFKSVSFLVDSWSIGFTGSGNSVTFNACNFICYNTSLIVAFSMDAPLTFINCSIIADPGYILEPIRTANALVDFRFYNCCIVSSNNVGIFRDNNAFSISVYNCVLLTTGGTAVTSFGAATINQNYNITNVAWSEGLTDSGANNTVKTIDQVGFPQFDSDLISSPLDLRIVSSSEVTGTTNANGVDLTTLYTTDIDGRPRTTYAIGCSEGYKVYDASTYPTPDETLETATTDGVPGTYHESTISEVQQGVLFGPNSSYEGTYDNSTNPNFVLSSQGGNWDDTSLTDAVIQLGINYGLGSTGTLSLAVPPTPTLVSLVAGDGQFTATFTGTGTIKVAYRVTGTGAWSYDTQSVVGDGSITVTGITNSATYQAFTYALVAGAPSYPSNVMYVIPRSATCQFNSNPDWPRWIFASVCKHFDDCKGNYDVFIEGQYRNADIKKDFFELRLDGPYITEVNKNYYNLYLEVNVLVQSQMDDTNYHRIHTDVGYAASLFRNISLYKYGNGVNDTQELFGCLELLQDTQTRKRVQINHFGQIDPKVRLTQATVEGHYEVFLQGE